MAHPIIDLLCHSEVYLHDHENNLGLSNFWIDISLTQYAVRQTDAFQNTCHLSNLEKTHNFYWVIFLEPPIKLVTGIFD